MGLIYVQIRVKGQGSSELALKRKKKIKDIQMMSSTSFKRVNLSC